MMKIIFMGTPQAAAISLERLVNDGHDIVGVYAQPDRPSGRGKQISFSPVKEIALKRGLRLLQPIKVRTSEAFDEFRSLNADVVVVVAYGRILPEPFLDAFQHGAVNVHFSLLPKYRGAAPVNWAIVNGETVTGVTTMKMDAGLDTGDILLQRSTAIGDGENAVGLMERLSHMGADLISETLTNIESIDPVKQDDSAASLAPILKKEDGLIDWSAGAVEIERRVRGFQPFPSSYTFHDGHRLTIWKATVAENITNEDQGTVIERTRQRLLIACGGRTALSVAEIQPEGKRRMSVRDFLNGAKIAVGDQLGPLRSTELRSTTSKTG